VGFVVDEVALGLFPSTFGLSLAVSFHQPIIIMHLPVTLVILASDTSLSECKSSGADSDTSDRIFTAHVQVGAL
jgi:hypothetical protein